MDNPFVYGKIVTGNDFCDREKEVRDLVRDLRGGERIFLISPRRYGKSSLIAMASEKLKQAGLLVAYIDIFKASSLTQLLEIYSQAISRAAESTSFGFTKFVRDFLSGIRPKVVIGPDGKPKIEIGFELNKKDVLVQLSDVYDLPQKIAQKRKKRFVIIFDEFQEIANLGGEKTEKAMRASMQRQPLVSYLFAGSKRHMMYSMVSDRNRAFYKMARIMTLDKLPRSFFLSHLENKFKKTGFRLEKGVIEKVLDAAEEYPYNAQFICHKLWDMNFEDKIIRIKDINKAIEEILDDQNMAYIALWETLSNHQKRLLASIAKRGGENIQGSEFINMGGLSAASSVQTSKSILLKRDILDKEGSCYLITDIFFKEWILRRATA
jgi:AAA+ ATPase superfamily predicted ATPase